MNFTNIFPAKTVRFFRTCAALLAIATLGSVGSAMATDLSWVDNALPLGASAGADSDAWTWVSSNPAPVSGTMAHQSTVNAGLHQHYFDSATATMAVTSGNTLYAYVYLDPANPPSEVMLQWTDGSWEHRAYWGANSITYGASGSTSRYYAGALPAAGQWVRLEIPASTVGLDGATVKGMSFTLYGGKATWDNAGTASSSQLINLPTVSVNATTPNAAEAGPVSGVFTITRTGGTLVPLVVNYTLGGTAVNGTDYNALLGVATIPIGAASTTVTVTPIDDSLVEGSETAVLNLSALGTYTVSSPSSATVTIVDNDTATQSTNTTTNTVALASTNLLAKPKIGDNALHIIAPTILEVELINTKTLTGTVTNWNFVDANSTLSAPATSQFAVTVNGQSVAVSAVGFKRRPAYAPLLNYDLRIKNDLYLQLASPIADNAVVEVKNPGAALWPASMIFTNTAAPLRTSTAVHVNQEGYVPSFPKEAEVGYYLGSLGELTVPSTTFTLVDAATGSQVYQGTLTLRQDFGYVYTPTPYQKVMEANFTSFTTPGTYQLVVPGLGASLPFQINEGVVMDFARTYALGMYHQRCGTSNSMPFTRFTHDACHTAAVSVPSPAANYPFTWTTIAGYASTANANNPPQTAPLLTSEANQLYPFVNKGTLNLTGGHHDAGDYSKYTINVATLTHTLMFAVDSLPGVSNLDNMGIPESGDGIPDVLQEAKWEADYMSKIQDADGGFYFLVYPINSEYESNQLPENGSQQVVWPKNTCASAAATAALAEAGSSPLMKRYYPAAAALYMQKANLGWQFLTNAIAKYGKAGAYQKITFYGDDFTHDDELAWAASAMYAATGNPAYQTTLMSWFDPSSSATWRWGWWHMYSSYGNAIRTYAFAAKSGRLNASQLDATFLAKCNAEILQAGDDAVTWCQQSAYGTSFPLNTKHVQSAGWYFSSDQAFDVTVAYQITAKSNYLDTIIRNMNYEGGCNPVNMMYVTGLGWKRQHEIVSQYAQNDRRDLPPDGIPLGNVQTGFSYVGTYGTTLSAAVYPSDGATSAMYPFYDRWGDSFNVTTEFVGVDQARSLASLAAIANMTSVKTQAWTSAVGQITVPSGVAPLNTPMTVSLTVPGMDLSTAKIVWEARDQEPAYGPTFTFSPKNTGVQWVEAEAQWPDGRRSFAVASFSANSPLVNWVNAAPPAGGTTSADGGDSWNWVAPNPASPTGSAVVDQSNIGTGEHQHYFVNATATMQVDAGDTLFAWVYLDPANPPSEIMLQFNNGSWEHRAYWGANTLSYGISGTASRYYAGPLPATGQWVKLQVPATAIGVDGTILNGIAFTLYGGRVSWDTAGKTSASSDSIAPTVSISTPLNNTVLSGSSGTLTATAADNVGVAGVQFKLDGANLGSEITTSSYTLAINPALLATGSHSLTAVARDAAGNQTISAPVTISVNNLVAPLPTMSIKPVAGHPMLTWPSSVGQIYQVGYKTNLASSSWVNLSGNITGTSTTTTWTDSSTPTGTARFYVIKNLN